jgi:hypothetical protein
MSDSKLTPPIAKLLAWCFDHPTRRRKHAFAGGLSITVYIDLADRRHVMLARRGDVGPSAQEAKTVLAHWPEPVPAGIEWTPAKVKRFAILVAIWKAPVQPEQLELGETRQP